LSTKYSVVKAVNHKNGETKMNQEKSKTIIWGQLSGSVTSMIIGFTYGGGVFGSTTFSKGKEIGRVAIADRLTTMCMSKFNQDPEKKTKLIEMNSMDAWYAEKYVKDQG
jgi:hypothetical protein